MSWHFLKPNCLIETISAAQSSSFHMAVSLMEGSLMHHQLIFIKDSMATPWTLYSFTGIRCHPIMDCRLRKEDKDLTEKVNLCKHLSEIRGFSFRYLMGISLVLENGRWSTNEGLKSICNWINKWMKKIEPNVVGRNKPMQEFLKVGAPPLQNFHPDTYLVTNES